MSNRLIVQSPGITVCGEFDVTKGTKQANKIVAKETNDRKYEHLLVGGDAAKKITRKCNTSILPQFKDFAHTPRVIAQDPKNPLHYRGTPWHIDSIRKNYAPQEGMTFMIGSTILPTLVVTGEIDATAILEDICEGMEISPKLAKKQWDYVPGCIFSTMHQNIELVDSCIDAAIASGQAKIQTLEPGQIGLVAPGTVHRAVRPEDAPASSDARLTIEFYPKFN